MQADEGADVCVCVKENLWQIKFNKIYRCE